MKRFVALFVLFCLSVCFLCGCQSRYVTIDDSAIVIKASTAVMKIEKDTTLKEYMDALSESGRLSYEAKDGMIISINGVENDVVTWTASWMLYTNDPDNSNSAWGEAEYNGEVYGSASWGYESLIIKEGYTYIWVYTVF